MANDYLISKWRTWFAFFDHNKDGKISYGDMERARDEFTKLSKFEGEKKKTTDEIFTKWWCEYIFWGKEEITVDEFVAHNNAHFKANNEKFLERMQKLQDIICNMCTTEDKGVMTEEEFLIVYKAVGREDAELDRKFFQQFNPIDHKVPKTDMIKYWTHYLTSEDSSIPDPVKNGFDADISHAN